jgi:hypothetical protein
MMKGLVPVCLLVLALSGAADAGPHIPAVAVHIESHDEWDCRDRLPAVDIDDLVTTYDGVGRIDAFVVFYNFDEARGVAFGLEWPEAWGEGSWHDCGDLRIGSIKDPGDMTSVVWQTCVTDTAPLIAGWLTLTATSPGSVGIIPSQREEAIAILDCDRIDPSLSEAMISLRAGVGGLKGDSPSVLTSIENRRWLVRPDSTGDAPTINQALRLALPGDTVMVAGGTYREHLTLRRGVAVVGSWSTDFASRDPSLFPSIVDARGDHGQGDEHNADAHESHVHGPDVHSAVNASLGADSSTVLDGFVLTGGEAKQGGGISLRSGAGPVLRNLIICSNKATYGGGMFCNSSSPAMENCLIAGNEAELGGALCCTAGASPIVSSTTIVANRARTGAAIAAMSGSSPTIQRSVIAYHSGPSPMYIQDEGSAMVVSCCDLWQNVASESSATAEEAVDLRGNISDDPRFTNLADMDFTPEADSPVLSVPECGSIGTPYARVPAEARHGERY